MRKIKIKIILNNLIHIWMMIIYNYSTFVTNEFSEKYNINIIEKDLHVNMNKKKFVSLVG